MIHMGEGGSHAPGYGRLRPFVKGRGMRRQQWCLLRRGRVRRSPVYGPAVVVALTEWVCRMSNRNVVLRSGNSEEVGARSEHVL